MGYRSTVTIYIVEQEDLSIKSMIKAAESIEKMGSDCYTIGTNSEGKNVLKVYYDWFKWYSGYDLVKYWNKIMNKVGDENYLFTRIGEENDTEQHGGYGDACFVSEFEYDVDFKEQK